MMRRTVVLNASYERNLMLSHAVRFDVHFKYEKLSDERAFNYLAKGWLEDEHGKMYFVVRPSTLGFQCWSLGDDSSLLAPDEAYEACPAALTVWLALPESLRCSLHDVNNPDAT
ncbi:hypothetical protein [Noviherbaspirillum suwonense]|uniref:Uncharacterized protein n=1 Tax=Noviherbaspirillum suwonense TaxID=1224511 RepID=A0ABY1PQW0_9BURK|nr:hypothetical protein [Noviherbaspirillum suwonense]SMP43039.1 hypothetical protein SAMN06295970_101258 [Noviherbaspirillum suwonense]